MLHYYPEEIQAILDYMYENKHMASIDHHIGGEGSHEVLFPIMERLYLAMFFIECSPEKPRLEQYSKSGWRTLNPFSLYESNRRFSTPLAEIFSLDGRSLIATGKNEKNERIQEKFVYTGLEKSADKDKFVFDFLQGIVSAYTRMRIRSSQTTALYWIS